MFLWEGGRLVVSGFGCCCVLVGRGDVGRVGEDWMVEGGQSVEDRWGSRICWVCTEMTEMGDLGHIRGPTPGAPIRTGRSCIETSKDLGVVSVALSGGTLYQISSIDCLSQ